MHSPRSSQTSELQLIVLTLPCGVVMRIFCPPQDPVCAHIDMEKKEVRGRSTHTNKCMDQAPTHAHPHTGHVT